MLRSHEAGSLRKSDAGQIVTLAGWVSRRRDHGGVAFIDLRDASGSVQVVIRDEKVAGSLRAEWCLLITGEVVARPAGNENTNLPTGEIEVMGDAVVVLSELHHCRFQLIVEMTRTLTKRFVCVTDIWTCAVKSQHRI
jgi:aspartyl-tRNA synthetase